MTLDRESGSAMASKDFYLFGQFDMKIKLIPRNSAGTVLILYKQNHDEIDFEFLGNVDGKPIAVQQIFLLMDWIIEKRKSTCGLTQHKISTVISFWLTRLSALLCEPDAYKSFCLLEGLYILNGAFIKLYKGAKYPYWQPMELKISIWNGGDWATDGGKTKIDWSKAPFVAT